MTKEASSAAFVGRSIARVNDPVLLRGEAAFVADLAMPGMLHAAIIRSSVAHARVLAIDTAPAASLPGVVAILTGDTIATATHALPCTWALPGQVHHGYPILEDTVRYVGQPVGIVVAMSPGVALDAVDIIEVAYEPRPVVIDAELATATGVTQLYPDVTANLAIDLRVGSTNAAVESIIAAAPHVVAGRFRVQRQTGAPIETRGVVASCDRATGMLTMWTSTQTPHHVRDDLAAVLGIRHDRVRVVAPQVGGGFGPKDHLYPDEVLVCLASRHVGAPVRWIEQRSEHMVATVHARDQVHHARLAFDRDGRFLALDVRIVVDLGAQCSNVGGGPAFTTAALLEGPYRFDAAGATVHGVLTNKTPSGAYRGFGQAEAAWSRERLIDRAAAVIGVSPVELRRHNMIAADEMPFMTHSGQSYDSGDYTAALDRAAELIGPRTQVNDGRRRGIGIASYVQFAGSATVVERNINFRIPGYETVVLRMEPDGTVALHTGVSPHGQGLETTLAQIAADGVGLPIEDITVIVGDTATTPYSAGTIASRSLMMGGGATVRAAAQLRADLFELAALRLEADPADLEVVDRRVQVRGSPSSSIAVEALARDAWLGWDLPVGRQPGLEARYTFDPPDCVYSYATHAVAIAVDPETGTIAVERYVVVQDCGVIVNPMIVEGQIHGAVVQGIGGALHEAIVYDRDGQPLASTLVDYGLPLATDVPFITIEHQHHPTPRVPGGMKGMAEGGVIPTAAAIGNALADAMPEIAELITETPLAPQRVFEWISAAGRPEAPRITTYSKPTATDGVGGR